MINTEPGGGIIYLDTETCGFYGQPVIIQYAQGDGSVIIHEFFRSPILESLTLLENICNNQDGVCGFNMTFDWFQICKCYTTLSLLGEKVGHDEYPEDHIDLMGELESEARDGLCLKPVKVCDLMLVARKGPYQSMMNRGDVRIRRVPTALAWKLADELESRIPIKDIYFARRKDKKAEKWKIYDIEDEDGNVIADFKDVVLSFAPSSALKVLVIDALGIQPDAILLFTNVAVDDAYLPQEFGFAPFATAVGKTGDWKGAWPAVIEQHIRHWAFNELARKYACKDVEYLPALYRYFGNPTLGDDDSELACMVAAIRWHGFMIDPEGLKKLKSEALIKAAKTPTAPGPVRKYIEQVLGPMEKQVLKGGTKKVILEDMRDNPIWTRVPCEACDPDGMVTFGDSIPFSLTPPAPVSDDLKSDEDIEADELAEYANSEMIDDTIAVALSPLRDKCEVCDGHKFFRHPASVRAEEVLNARMAGKEIELYDKLLIAGRFHASFVIIGTLSSRMAGTDKLNAQGIKKTKSVRRCFPLAYPGYQLCGGDFKSFEVVLADAVYNDPDLRKELQTKNVCTGCKGKKTDKSGGPCSDCEGTGICDQSIHAIFGTFVYPGYDYVGILNTKGTQDDKYTRSKSAVFAMLYGGEAYTLMTRLGVPIEVADAAYQRFSTRYKEVGECRRKVNAMFECTRQPGGLGSKVEWHEPADYIESVFGFRRYFTLENAICKALFEIANKPPKDWAKLKFKVTRRDREQSVQGAVQSALYGATFGLASSTKRAAANHVIQSAGAQVTKHLQRNMWDIQPSGIHPFRVLPMNVHDELMVPTLPEYIPQLNQVVYDTVEGFRPRVPLIGIDWGDNLTTWADK